MYSCCDFLDSRQQKIIGAIIIRLHRYLDYLIDPGFQGVDSKLFCCLKIRLIEMYTQDTIFHR